MLCCCSFCCFIVLVNSTTAVRQKKHLREQIEALSEMQLEKKSNGCRVMVQGNWILSSGVYQRVMHSLH